MALAADGAAHVVGRKVEGEGRRAEYVRAGQAGDAECLAGLGPESVEAVDVDVGDGHLEDGTLVAWPGLSQGDRDLAACGILPGDAEGHVREARVFNTVRVALAYWHAFGGRERQFRPEVYNTAHAGTWH